MNHQINFTEIEKLGFKKSHRIKHVESHVAIVSEGDIPASYRKKPAVYLWLSPLDEKVVESIYVGMTGVGVDARMKAHEGGFKGGSKTGVSNAAALSEMLTEGRELFVYTRVAAIEDVFGIKVPNHAAEEAALIDLFKPWLNRAGNKVQGAAVERDKVNSDIIDSFEDMIYFAEFVSYVEAFKPEERRVFLELLGWIFSVSEIASLDQRLIGNYTHQPSGLNGQPMLVFAEFSRSGAALRHSWRVRLPLKTVSIILPTEFMSPNLDSNLVNLSSEPGTSPRGFAPKDIHDFLANPKKYVTFR